MGSPPFSPEGFSGVVRVRGESWAFGYADRAHEIPNTVDTQFAIASGVKGFTAVVAVSTLPLEIMDTRRGSATTSTRTSSATWRNT